MSVYVLLNLLNELGKRDKMRGLLVVYQFYCMTLFQPQMRRHMINFLLHSKIRHHVMN